MPFAKFRRDSKWCSSFGVLQPGHFAMRFSVIFSCGSDSVGFVPAMLSTINKLELK